MTTAPGGKLPGVFAAESDAVLANLKRPTVRIRYYLAAGDALLRIPQRLHHDLIAGKRSLPEFACSEQRILEIVARQLTRSTYAVSAQGLIYRFDDHGSLILDPDQILPDLLEDFVAQRASARSREIN